LSIFFMCFLAIWTSSFEKTLFNSFTHFFTGLWFWRILIFCAHCIFWLSVLFQMNSWQRFSPILWVAYSV
jgi:hypothetical protein